MGQKPSSNSNYLSLSSPEDHFKSFRAARIILFSLFCSLVSEIFLAINCVSKMSLLKVSEQHYQEGDQQSSLASVDDAPIVSSYNDRIRPLLDTVERSKTHLDGTVGEDLYSGRQAHWQDLPIEISAAIAKNLTSIGDYISFRGVCRSWRSAATFANFDREFPRVPWLMYAPQNKEEEKAIVGEVTNVFDLESKTQKIADFPPAVEVPYLSWRGWILDASNDCVDVNLTHPIWRVKIELPGSDTFPAQERHDENFGHRVIKKMVLSGSPADKIDLLVMVIWGYKNQLGFSRPGDTSWSVMASSGGNLFRDIIYHKRRLYAVDAMLRVVEFDVHSANPTQVRQFPFLPGIDAERFGIDAERFDGAMNYLVESSGKFLIVSRCSFEYETVGFRIFEFDLMDGSHIEIRELGSRALFLGCNSSICLELSAAWSKIKPNRIYFTDNIGPSKFVDMGVYDLSNIGPSKFVDMGVYDLSSKEVEGFFVGSGSIRAPSTWVVPSF